MKKEKSKKDLNESEENNSDTEKKEKSEKTQETASDTESESTASDSADSKEKVFYKKPSFYIALVCVLAALCAVIVFAVKSSDGSSSDDGSKTTTSASQTEVVKNDDGKNALKIGDTYISVGMYNCYYNEMVQQYLYYAQQGYYTIDTTKDYSQQTTTDSDGNTVTWADLFVSDTVTQLKRTIALYEKATAEGITLSDDEKSKIDETLDDVKKAAEDDNTDLSDYIEENYGEGCTYDILEEIYNQNYLAEKYYEKLTVETSATDDEIETYYENHKDECTGADISYIQIQYSSDSSSAESTAKDCVEKISAQKDVKSKNKKLKSLIGDACADSIESYVSSGYFESASEAEKYLQSSCETTIKKSDETLCDEGLNWIFSDDTKTGDCKYFVDSDNSVVFVILRTGDPQILKDTVYSVRHILSQAEADDDGNISDDSIKEAEDKIDSLLDEYNKGDKTELSFAILADENSDDTSTTSSGSNGLYGGFYGGVKAGDSTDAFDEWITDKSRKKGDVGKVFVEDYYTGYHLIYYLGSQKEYEYICQQAVISDKKNEQMNSLVDNIKVIKYENGMKNTTVAKPEETTTSASQTTTASSQSTTAATTNQVNETTSSKE